MLTKSQSNVLSMEQRTLELLKDNLDIVSSVPALADTITELETLTVQIEAKSNEKSEATTGKTDNKLQAEADVVKAILPVAGALHSFASKKSDIPLMEKTAVHKSRLEHMRDEDLSTKAKSISDLAAANSADIVPDRTSAAKVAALDTKRKAFDDARGAQSTSIPQRQGAGKSLVDLFKETGRLLHDEIDELMKNLTDDYPQLYTEYEKARQITDLGVRHNPSASSGQVPSTGSGQVPPTPAPPKA